MNGIALPWHAPNLAPAGLHSLTPANIHPSPHLPLSIVPQIRAEVERLGVTEGFVNVLSRHTTTAITINECEPRLLDDIRQVSHYE